MCKRDQRDHRKLRQTSGIKDCAHKQGIVMTCICSYVECTQRIALTSSAVRTVDEAPRESADEG